MHVNIKSVVSNLSTLVAHYIYSLCEVFVEGCSGEVCGKVTMRNTHACICLCIYQLQVMPLYLSMNEVNYFLKS